LGRGFASRVATHTFRGKAVDHYGYAMAHGAALHRLRTGRFTSSESYFVLQLMALCEARHARSAYSVTRDRSLALLGPLMLIWPRAGLWPHNGSDCLGSAGDRDALRTRSLKLGVFSCSLAYRRSRIFAASLDA